MTENEARELRKAKVEKLCRVLGTTPMYICDPLLTFALQEPSVDPTRLEQWMERRRLIRDGESIRDALVRHYGKATADLAESLI